ncbi:MULTISPECIES: hypothetical protein [Bacillus cereus group]|uniref:hypothetical protein n=1 Tax=Bacillus cereus group TaxID=86661 RepID=UPI0011A101F5|nr:MULTISPECIES: hypothetical protein [Bacillus cereus group]MEA1012930.1 hypothetical protein [Bacillus cereus]
MKIKSLSVLLVSSLFLSSTIPGLVYAKENSSSSTPSPLEIDLSIPKGEKFDPVETKHVLEQIDGIKNVSVTEEGAIRTVTLYDANNNMYTSIYNTETEQIELKTSSLDENDKQIATGLANSLVTKDSSGPQGQVIDPGGSAGWDYKSTKYGDSRSRDGFAAALITLISGLGFGKVAAAIVSTFMAYVGFVYTPEYWKTDLYTRHDAYYKRTKLVFYAYSDSNRKKLKRSFSRAHEYKRSEL